MSSNEERLRLLDDMILQSIQLKDMIVLELSKLTEALLDVIKAVGGMDPDELQDSLYSIKDFMQTSTRMMKDISVDAKTLSHQATKLRTLVDQVGYMVR